MHLVSRILHLFTKFIDFFIATHYHNIIPLPQARKKHGRNHHIISRRLGTQGSL